MLKKASGALCFMLALTIIFSSFGAAGAAFTDEGLITYKTAVGVMHGAGILGGYTDGSFNPTGSITREESVKMLAFAVLGESRVMELPRSTVSFSDIPADRWSSPYIGWAVESGIIGGLGDGSFNPTGKVTGYQLAKMMLCAAGYGQNGEYSGASWERRAAADGFAKGIFTNISNADPSRSVTREEAALYIFNGITRVEQVIYDENQGKYLPADGTEALDNTIAAQVHGIIDNGSSSTVFRGTLTESRANGAESTVVSGRSFDFFAGLELIGHSVAVYTNGGEGVKSRVYYISDESQTVTLSESINSKARFIDVFGEDVSVSESLLVYGPDGTLTEETSIDGFSSSGFQAPKGKYVFFEGELISYMPLIPEFAARIGPTVAGLVDIGGESYSLSDIVSIGSYTEGDVVLAKVAGERINIRTALSYTGVFERLAIDGGNRFYTVDGTVFAQSPIENRTEMKDSSPVVGNTYTLYFDSNYKCFALLAQD